MVCKRAGGANAKLLDIATDLITSLSQHEYKVVVDPMCFAALLRAVWVSDRI